jgi:hypothetical protein
MVSDLKAVFIASMSGPSLENPVPSTGCYKIIGADVNRYEYSCQK